MNSEIAKNSLFQSSESKFEIFTKIQNSGEECLGQYNPKFLRSPFESSKSLSENFSASKDCKGRLPKDT